MLKSVSNLVMEKLFRSIALNFLTEKSILFVEKLKAQKRMNVNNQLHQILSLSKLYMKEDFVEAINKCLEYNVFNHSFISGYLEKNHKKSFKIEPVKIKLDMPKENVKRDLSQYDLL